MTDKLPICEDFVQWRYQYTGDQLHGELWTVIRNGTYLEDFDTRQELFEFVVEKYGSIPEHFDALLHMQSLAYFKEQAYAEAQEGMTPNQRRRAEEYGLSGDVPTDGEWIPAGIDYDPRFENIPDVKGDSE